MEVKIKTQEEINQEKKEEKKKMKKFIRQGCPKLFWNSAKDGTYYKSKVDEVKK